MKMILKIIDRNLRKKYNASRIKKEG